MDAPLITDKQIQDALVIIRRMVDYAQARLDPVGESVPGTPHRRYTDKPSHFHRRAGDVK